MNKLILSLVCLTILTGPVIAAPKKPVPLSTEQRVQLLERKLKAMSSLVVQVDSLQREVQQLRGEIEVQGHAMDALKKRQRDLYLDVDQRLGQLSHGSLAAPPPPTDTQAVSTEQSAEVPSPSAGPVVGRSSQPIVVTPKQASGSPTPAGSTIAGPAVPAGDPALEEKNYKAAFEMLMQRRYDDSRNAFQLFLAQYPDGNYADNAQYWLAEASYVTRNFDLALADFQAVIQQYPASKKVPDALLKSSFIYYEKQQWAEARQTLETLIAQYPNTTASKLAAQRLQRMKSENR